MKNLLGKKLHVAATIFLCPFNVCKFLLLLDCGPMRLHAMTKILADIETLRKSNITPMHACCLILLLAICVCI